MATPFQCIDTLGHSGIICASRASSIHTFTFDGSHLSSWSHPINKVSKPDNLLEGKQTNESNGGAPDGSGPPHKKRRTEAAGDQSPSEQEQQLQPEAENGRSAGDQQKLKRPPPQEHPFVTLLSSTADGKHVVAVTGQDKIVWVLEHDGAGRLKELSQRVMPKRPCSIALTEDGSTIISADKFGDVYSIPLLPASDDVAAADAAVAPSPAASTPASGRPVVVVSKGANHLTVHSQRNLKALEDQRRYRESKEFVPKEGPTFEHQLLLGHVSMLTAVVTARSSPGRSYILTADRDEHIRVSRGIPQAHITEAYCLGHGSFVSALCVLPSRPGLLVSGGGDDSLFVWDWTDGRLLSRADLLGPLRLVVPGAAKLAVTKLYSYHYPVAAGGGPGPAQKTYVLAICERVPAAFVFEVQETTLVPVQTFQLPGNALDLGVVETAAASQAPRLLVSVDTAAGSTDGGADASLVVFDLETTTTTTTTTENRWVHNAAARFEGPARAEGDDDDVPVSREELDKVLYTVENLRKTEHEEEAPDAEQAVRDSTEGSVAPA